MHLGNLVCPANYDLGEDKKIVMTSTTEGDDKPSKYPSMFHVSDVLIVNKIDLLPYVDFNMQKVRENALAINPNLEIIELSCKTGEGLNQWIDWIRQNIKKS